MAIQTIQWLLVAGAGLLMLFISPWAKTTSDFFFGTQKEQTPSLWKLTSSLVISWIFAKSITNAANLGQSFGLPGVLGYAFYYLSFLTAGLVIYQMRTKGGVTSIPSFIQNKYGKGAMYLFTVLIVIRLFNEVWSNTMVIGSYFGEPGSSPYIGSIVLFTALTLGYTLKGGMSSSILTDVIQMMLFSTLLIAIWGFILPQTGGRTIELVQDNTWSWAQGGNFALVALLQCFSYPFHDPVMTDRGFIAEEKRTRKAFILAAVIGFVCIVLFGSIGLFARWKGWTGQATVEMATYFGPMMLLLMNLIMITSAASTLDSTFSSFTKLWHVDLLHSRRLSISGGRMAMLVLTILGTLPVFFNPDILSATTISGTMVLGLAPVFLGWKARAPKIAYFASVSGGLVLGLSLIFDWYPSNWVFTEGKYADLLSANVVGTILCFGLFYGILAVHLWQQKRK